MFIGLVCSIGQVYVGKVVVPLLFIVNVVGLSFFVDNVVVPLFLVDYILKQMFFVDNINGGIYFVDNIFRPLFSLIKRWTMIYTFVGLLPFYSLIIFINRHYYSRYRPKILFAAILLFCLLPFEVLIALK